MIDVKRYNLRMVDRYSGEGSGERETHAYMKACERGEYVRADDYSALLDRLEAAEREAKKAIGEKPENSLASHDAVIQADTLGWLLGNNCIKDADIAEIRDRMAELRRQADPDLCVDEGCPHHGTPHVCINRQAEEDGS